MGIIIKQSKYYKIYHLWKIILNLNKKYAKDTPQHVAGDKQILFSKLHTYKNLAKEMVDESIKNF